MTLKTDNYQIGLDSVTDSKNYLLDTDVTGALRIRRNSDGSGATIFNISPDGETVARIKQIAAKTLTGTSVDWQPSSSDGPPSWTKKVTVMFFGASTAGAGNDWLVQLGTSGGTVSSGYLSTCVSGASGVVSASITNAHFLNDQVTLLANYRGHVIFTKTDTNIWVGSSNLTSSSGAGYAFATSDVNLGAVLDRIKLTTVGGTDTFDAGSVSVIYEG